MGWTSERFAIVAQRSQALHGNKYVLPVALVVAERKLGTVKAPEIGVALGGRLAPNRVLEGLEWLCAMGVMGELPYPGRPSPRLFETRASAYWSFVEPFSGEARTTTMTSSRNRRT